ncbi:hypothetical protein GNF09_34425 [Nostoc sp. UCD120]|nr:hypothetical protein [Nostoc sp. UCD120]
MSEPKSLLEVYEFYLQHIKTTYSGEKAQRIIRETQTAILRFLLLGLGYDQLPTGRKMTEAEKQTAYEFMKTIPLSQLFGLSEAVAQGFELTKASKSSQNTYGGRIQQICDWGKQQYWWTREASQEANYCPAIRKGYGRANTKQLTERRKKYSAYQLAPKEISVPLQTELQEWEKFLRAKDCPGRLSKPISASSAKTYLKHILLILGWLHRYQGIPLSELSLNLLIPKITDEELEELPAREKEKFWQKHQYYVDELIGKYFEFLRKQMDSFSPSTKKFKINALSSLAKFQYYTEVEHSDDYNNIPIFKVINKYSCAVRQEKKQWKEQRRSVVDMEDKWPKVIPTKTALHSVRLQILEPLRLECRAKYNKWQWRKDSAITMSIQRYLAWSFLADMPARRQEEYRNLKVALSCPIERPSEVPTNAIYQPLPPAHVRLNNNYIYKTYFYESQYYESGVWVLDIQEYKTCELYGPQSIVIRNHKFHDGNCLYDYFERHLYGWYFHSNGKKKDKWLTTGRISFNPRDCCYICNQNQNSEFWSWGYFFIQPLVGCVYNSTEFKDLVRNAAHRLTNVPVTPHVMRYVWATWAYQVGLNEQEQESLAYAMGHDVKTMLEFYENCTPNEKRRPIEEVINEVLFNTLSIQKQSSEENLDQLAQKLLQLPTDELQHILQLISPE